jgi:hypothetical protein
MRCEMIEEDPSSFKRKPCWTGRFLLKERVGRSTWARKDPSDNLSAFPSRSVKPTVAQPRDTGVLQEYRCSEGNEARLTCAAIVKGGWEILFKEI